MNSKLLHYFLLSILHFFLYLVTEKTSQWQRCPHQTSSMAYLPLNYVFIILGIARHILYHVPSLWAFAQTIFMVFLFVSDISRNRKAMTNDIYGMALKFPINLDGRRALFGILLNDKQKKIWTELFARINYDWAFPFRQMKPSTLRELSRLYGVQVES